MSKRRTLFLLPRHQCTAQIKDSRVKMSVLLTPVLKRNIMCVGIKRKEYRFCGVGHVRYLLSSLIVQLEDPDEVSQVS